MKNYLNFTEGIDMLADCAILNYNFNIKEVMGWQKPAREM